jgi:beta-glucosidase
MEMASCLKSVLGLLVFFGGSGLMGQSYMDPSQPLEKRVNDLVARMTTEEKVSLLSETPPAISRLGIAQYNYGNEALHGIMKGGGATVFPQAIALAATWDPQLVQQVATAISDEARAKYNQTRGAVDAKSARGRANGMLSFFSPTINMARDPRWGRTQETYGEDPFLTSRLAVAYVKGMQGNDPHYLKTIATPKHFAANNEEFDRFKANANISERTLREYYLPAFRAVVEEGRAKSIMSSYNSINGIPSTANRWLLTDLLRGEWGFDGFVVTDCGAVSHLFDQHHYAKGPEQAAAAALNAGVDMECGSWSDTPYVFKNYLLKAQQDGLVTTASIDRAVTNVLRLRFELGMFDPFESVPYSAIPRSVVGSREHMELARQAARESMVLLKNEGQALPIDPRRVHSIAIVGPGADVAAFGEYSGHPVNPAVTPLDGIKARAGQKVRVEDVRWIQRSNDGKPAVIPQAQVTPQGAAAEQFGWKGEYFSNRGLSGAGAVRIDPAINFDWLNLPPDAMLSGDSFSVRWSGELHPFVSGEHKLTVTSDDGVRLTVAGKILVDAWDAKPPIHNSAGNQWTKPEEKKTYTVELPMVEGHSYPIVVEYRNQGGAFIALNWQTPATEANAPFARERKAAADSDLVIAVLAPGPADGIEGEDRKNLDLPADQQEMMRQISAVNPHVVAVLVNGGPLAVREIYAKVSAMVEAWYPGEQGGNALADVLFGGFNPAGRLPLTFYEDDRQLPPFGDYEVEHGRTYMYLKGKPLFPFGYGLSYTTFHYSNLRLAEKELDERGTLHALVDVTNTGSRDGEEVVQLYVHPLEPGRTHAVRELKGFRRIAVPRGQTRTVAIDVPASSIGHFDTGSKRFEIDAGRVEVQLGSSSNNILLRDTVMLRRPAQ